MLFRLVTLAATVFIITVLAMLATLFGDPQAPANRWLNEHGGQLLAAEVAATIVLGLAAMAADRVRTLRQPSEEPPQDGLSDGDES